VEANVVNPPKVGGMGKNKEKLDIDKRQKHTEDEIIDTIERANKEFIAYDRRFEFSIHEKTKQIMVKIIDVTHEEVIREIQPEQIIDVVVNVSVITGIQIDEKEEGKVIICIIQ